MYRTQENKTRKDSRKNKIIAVPQLLYGCGNCVPPRKDKPKIRAAEISFYGKVKTMWTRLGKLRNEGVTQDLNMYTPSDKIQLYRQPWRNHLERVDDERLIKQDTHYAHEAEGL